MKRRLLPALAALFVFIAAIACNLSSDNRPPTLLPRASATPPPTIGFNTPAPNELPLEATILPEQQIELVLRNVIDQVESDRLMLHIRAMQDTYTRHVNSTQSDPARGIGAAANYILSQFNSIREGSNGLFSVLSPQAFNVDYGGVQTTQRNVVGITNGTEGGIIVIGAHYDSISFDRENGEVYAPGANDNGSGVAALIEMARILSTRQHRMTIMFVAFGAEEIGRRGSIAFIEDYLMAYNIVGEVRYMINLDIIGSSSGPDGQRDDSHIRLFSAEPNDSPSRFLARQLDLFGDLYMPGMDIELQSTVDRAERYSDHISFNEAGMTAVRFIEAFENPDRQHTDLDIIDAINPQYLARSTQVVLVGVTALADGPRPPANVSLREAGSGQRQLVWETVPDATSYLVVLRAPGSIPYNYQFPVGSNSVTWDGFNSSTWEAVSIAAQDANGLIGPVSGDFPIVSDTPS